MKPYKFAANKKVFSDPMKTCQTKADLKSLCHVSVSVSTPKEKLFHQSQLSCMFFQELKECLFQDKMANINLSGDMMVHDKFQEKFVEF